MIVDCVGVRIVSPKLAIAYCRSLEPYCEVDKEFGYRTYEVLVNSKNLDDNTTLDLCDSRVKIMYDKYSKKYWFRGEVQK